MHNCAHTLTRPLVAKRDMIAQMERWFVWQYFAAFGTRKLARKM